MPPPNFLSASADSLVASQSPSVSPVGSLLNWARRELELLGPLESNASAERLLAHLTTREPFQFYLDPRQPVGLDLSNEFKRLTALRKKGIPTAYLVGKAHFWDEVLEVGPGCLIPRPETETLVECFLENSGFQKEDAFSFLDLGCGSGAIGIALLRHYPKARAVFSDISEKALETAEKNLARYDLLSRTTIVQSDLFKAWSSQGKKEHWDAIVSNPPYLSEGDWKKVGAEIFFEPSLALDGGGDGFFFHRKILSESPSYLPPRACLFFEIGAGQSEIIRRELEESCFWEAEIFKDDLGIDRVVMARRDA